MKSVRILLALFFLSILFIANVRLHRPGSTETSVAQLRFLQESLEDGAAEQMQELFPEGYVFTWALYGVASAQVARSGTLDSVERGRLVEQARAAVMAVRTDEARAVFPTSLSPARGAFYSSWSLYVLAEYVRSAGPEAVPPELLELFREEARAFADALTQSSSPFLETYRGLTWPADTAVGVAALGIFDQLQEPEFEPVIKAWVHAVREHVDSELGALPHSAFQNPDIADEVRGSSLALMSRVLIDADSEFAREQYQILRDEFAEYRWGLPGILEYSRGSDGKGDVDSGPIIMGYSGPAIVVGASAARVHGDEELERILLGSVELAGVPFQWAGKRRYAGGVIPVGDAFIAWARSSPSGKDGHWTRVMPTLWAVPFHLASLLLGLLIVWRGGLLKSIANLRGNTRS